MAKGDESREQKRLNALRRPNFKIGPYQIRTDDLNYWFENDKGYAVTGYFGGINDALIRSLVHYHVFKTQDLSGSLDEYINKLKEAHKKFNDILYKTLEVLRIGEV